MYEHLFAMMIIPPFRPFVNTFSEKNENLFGFYAGLCPTPFFYAGSARTRQRVRDPLETRTLRARSSRARERTFYKWFQPDVSGNRKHEKVHKQFSTQQACPVVSLRESARLVAIFSLQAKLST